MRWERGRLLISELLDLGVISVAPKGLMVGKSPARYVLTHEGDVEIPHALIDGLDEVPGLIRLLDRRYGQSLETISTAIIILIRCYFRHDMLAWGGVDSQAIRHDWDMHSVTPVGQGFKVKARRRASEKRSSSQPFFMDVMRSLGVEEPDFPAWTATFWAALQILGDSGLLYEAVSLVDSQRKPLCPVRINDVYAVRSESEPSFIESISGAAFYIQAQNPKEEVEGVWFLLPFDPTKDGLELLGVTRLRFRCANPSTARGLIRDEDNIQSLRGQLIEADMIDDL